MMVTSYGCFARPIKNACLLFVLACVLSACQTAARSVNPTLVQGDEVHRVLMMPVDIEISELGLGVREPRADWTRTAEVHISSALKDQMLNRNVELIETGDAISLEDRDDQVVQLIKLHEAVASSIVLSTRAPDLLPNKRNSFDWTLGQSATALKEDYDADYALFTFVRDAHSSAERVMAGVVTALLFGVAPQGGQQIGYASLVDLETGQIVWFNSLVRGTGDLREPQPANEAMQLLLTDFPS